MEFSHYEEVPKNITETIMSGKAKSTDWFDKKAILA
jgi:hypothetical protein